MQLRAILKAISLIIFAIFLMWVYGTMSLEQKLVTTLMIALVIVYFVSLIWCYRHAYRIGAKNGHKNENNNHVQGNA
jgi:ABC-type nickel/cobalt efflux system permease component RcnA